MAGFAETWGQLPYVTRHAGAVALVLLAVYVVNPYLAVRLSWRIPQASWWEVWRYVLAPLSFTGSNVNGLISLFMFCSSLNTLELSVFRARSRSAYYLLWLAAGFNLFGPSLGMYAYLSGLVGAMTWTLAQEAPYDQTVLLVMSIQRRYVPLANIVIGLVANGGALQGIYEPICGIIIAHSYMFFTELLPNAGGPTALQSPPRFLRVLDDMEQSARKRGAYGAGRRLGKED